MVVVAVVVVMVVMVASLAEAGLPGEPTHVYLHLSICARAMEAVPRRESVLDIEG